MMKMTTFCAVAKVVFAFVIAGFYSPVEKVPRPFDLVSDPGKINKSEWGSVFLDQIFQGNAIKGEVSFIEIKTFLGEIIGLLHQVKVTVLHVSLQKNIFCFFANMRNLSIKSVT